MKSESQSRMNRTVKEVSRKGNSRLNEEDDVVSISTHLNRLSISDRSMFE
jgi:hypothetical protein